LTPFFDSKLRAKAEQYENLAAYVERMMLQYYPEFEWGKQREAA
jgi:hypothetical protein